MIDAAPTDTVVEIGCGAGPVLEKFQASRLIGVESQAIFYTKLKLAWLNGIYVYCKQMLKYSLFLTNPFAKSYAQK